MVISKLSSRQEKYQHDLRVLAYKLDKEKARHRLSTNGRTFLDDPKLKPQIEEIWRFIFQEPLFGEEAAKSDGKPRRGRKERPKSSPGEPLPKRSRRTKRDDET